MEATTVAVPQHLTALSKANRTREGRAAVKRQIQAGRRSIADVLYATPPEMETMTVGELVRSQYRWGRKRMSKMLGGLAISEHRKVGDLTARQRQAIVTEIATRHSRRR